MGFSIPTAHRFSSNVAASYLTLLRFPLVNFECKKKALVRACTHSVILEPTKLILLTRHADQLPSHRGRRLETGKANLLLAWDGNGTGSWSIFFIHVCGGMGVERDANGTGRD